MSAKSYYLRAKVFGYMMLAVIVVMMLYWLFPNLMR